MGLGFTNPFFLIIASIAIVVVTLVYSINKGNRSKLNRKWIALLSLPGLMWIVAFYSLGWRLYCALGVWPDHGTRQLSPSLILHYDVTGWMLVLVVLSAFCSPIAIALFCAIPRFRAHLIYPAFWGTVSWICFLTMYLAPSEFVSWWWD